MESIEEEGRRHRGTAAGPWPLLREVLAETAGLLAPRRCPCGRERTRLCADCAAELEGPPRRVESRCEALLVVQEARVRPAPDGRPAGVDLAPLLPVLALGPYQDRLRDLVLAWKNGGQLHLAPTLAAALAPAVAELAAPGPDEPGPAAAAPASTAPASPPPLLVPAPSSLAARIRRGEDHVGELVTRLARLGVGDAGAGRTRTTASQQGRSGRQRRHRRVEIRRADGLRDRTVVLVDDVVTTGATLRALHEALSAAGARVQGAVVLAAARWPEIAPADREETGSPRGIRTHPAQAEDRVAH